MGLEIFEGTKQDLQNVDFGATAEADFNAAVDLALNTAIPASPTAKSANQLINAKLIYLAPITTAANTTTFACTELIGYGNDFFKGWYAYLIWDAGGATAAPQGEYKLITDYVSTTGTFTIGAYTAAHAATDIVGILHPNIASLGDMAVAASTGAVGTTTSMLAYVKQLVTSQIAGTDGAAALAAVAYTKQAGVMQVKATTFELNQAAAAYTLLTGTTQDVEIESVTVRNLTNMTAGGTTSFSVQTNDTTAQTFISNTSAVAAQLTVGAQFSWVGACILKVGKLIQITVNGAASGGTDVMDVVVCYRAIVSGGYLA
jgi:hypothetical protein